jgi:ferredoxin-NADP reductase
MKAIFHDHIVEAENIWTFRFKPERPVDYVAGQFTELTIPHENPDSRSVKRWFTISGAPFDGCITITTKLSEPSSSFKSALSSLRQGAEVSFIEPMGDFVLPKDNAIPLVFVAGGIGITPFHSILTWLAENDEYRNIKLIYAVNNEDEIIFQDTFQKADIHPTIIVSNPSDEWGGERGKITADHILKLTEPSKDTLFYLSGPESMVETLQKDLITLDVPKTNIATDFFHNYPDY